MQAFKFALLGLVGVVGLLISTFGPFKIPYAETLAKNYYRYAIAGLVAVLAMLGGLIAIAVYTVDPNQFKTQIVRWVQERTQRDLLLEGEIKLTWFPRLGLEAGKATLSQRRSAREFAAIDSARITLAWLPLLRRQMQIDSAEVDGLRAQVARFKDGTTNIDDLLRDLGTVSPANIDLQGVRLTRANLQWNDEIAFQRGSLSDLNVEIGRLADGLAAPLKASARVDAPHAGIDARLVLEGRLLFDAQVGRVELAKVDAKLEGRSFGVDNLALNLKTDLTGHLGLHTLSAENIVLTTSSKSGLSILSARLVAPELRYIERKVMGSQFGMDLSIAHPDRTLTAALQIPSFESSGMTLRGAEASAQVSLRASGAHLRAQWVSPVALDLDKGRRVEFEAIDMNASASHPALAAQTPFLANGKLVFDLAQQSMHLALTGKLAGSELRGQLALSDWQRPHWTFELASAGLDLDAMLAQPCLALWSDDALPLDVSTLRDLSLAGQLRADKFRFCGMTASALSAQFDLQRSALHVAPILAKAYGGSVDASLAIDATAAARWSSKGSVSEIDLRALLGDVVRSPWLEGRGELAWDLSAEGLNLGALRSRTTGPVTLAVRGGKLAGIDLRAAMLEGRNDLGKATPAREIEFDASQRTAFNELKARLELRGGRAFGQSVELIGTPVHAVGTGEVAFDTGELDLRLSAAVPRPIQEFAPFAGASVPVLVDGPWRQPVFAFDFGATSGVAAQRPVDPVADDDPPQARRVAVAAPAPRPVHPRARR